MLRERQRAALVAYLAAHLRVPLTVWEQPHPVLPQDDHRPAVKELQQKLNVVQDAAGASPVLEIDGIFDDTTHNAVMAFQRAQGLPDNGTVDAATWAALDRAARRSLRDANDLYAHYLIDVEMSPCMMTSRIKQAHQLGPALRAALPDEPGARGGRHRRGR